MERFLEKLFTLKPELLQGFALFNLRIGKRGILHAATTHRKGDAEEVKQDRPTKAIFSASIKSSAESLEPLDSTWKNLEMQKSSLFPDKRGFFHSFLIG